ncbi:MAG: glucosaminidase domain-containing protein [Bacteroidales bacterium OttesenSCG-928-I14]|nr:glucosaminidase domain-containing protein [Bacteroidales bacterium OttesenSCG-928-I14]
MDYIGAYCPLAIEIMYKYEIPASITLSQSLLESNAGKSKLTKETNNHFGIKCHSDWEGECYYYSDDEQNECFRKYEKASDSFYDYSDFLHKNRYASLFTLNSKDYVGWANELQKCGYASDKFYACKLIKLIEDYNLYLFDEDSDPNTKKNTKNCSCICGNRIPYKSYNGLLYIIAKKKDSCKQIAEDVGIRYENLIRYNEISRNFRLCNGDIIYLEKKKIKAKIPYFKHVVKRGESMHKISQLHGVRMKTLYNLNKKSFNYLLVEGDTLQLR